ncbi:MAG TPA: alanine--tRNA ligase [Nitrososphaeraceae archaeon]
MGKKELAALFSSDPERYYKVALFDEMEFNRQKCTICGRFFWGIVKKTCCPDHEPYSFIDNPPTNKRLDYVNTWKEIAGYFKSKNHSIINRYPVVCRWRDDLYFTIASIVDFQRVMGNKVVFEIPANPLVVPQMCLRFNDVENVGMSGRHYTGFCMIGQTCSADLPGGYWKDKCIELDYGMLTTVLGIKPEEITFVEDVWIGAGAFGYSLEYFVRGLELGNAVFTEFEGNEDNYRIMKNKIIDMGAGLERLSWITMGTSTSYDCSFGPVVKKLINITGTLEKTEILSKYFGMASGNLVEGSLVPNNATDNVKTLKSLIAKKLKISQDELTKIISPYEAIYTITDHARTLLFAISDGSLPSNVGGGYNLRIILRRALSIMERMSWNSIRLEDITDMHIDYLKQIYPELEEHRDDVKTILQIESSRYRGSRERMDTIATSIKRNQRKLTIDDLIRMYESDGITPDFLMEVGVIESIPATFYSKLAEVHTDQTSVQTLKPIYGLEGIAPTRLLYYEDESIREFEATVLRVVEDKYVVIDQTAFYPRGGGQEPDKGKLDSFEVVEVLKQGDIVIHKLQNTTTNFIEGKTIHGTVNDRRRNLITKHHTATHILNSSARNNLGSWVWQNSAFKEEDYGRLDITHHSALNKEEIERIENSANDVIRQNLPVSIKIYDRGDAEQKYTFRIYQGGVVPTSNIRIVNIDGWDIEACGGTHVSRTGDIGLVKIMKSERIQDGVVRLEFTAGEAGLRYIQKQENHLNTIVHSLGSSKEKVVESFLRSMEDAELAKKKVRTILRKIAPLMAKSVSAEAKLMPVGNIKFYSIYDEELDDEYYIAIGERSIEIDQFLIYIALFSKGQGIRVIVFVGQEARKRINASMIAKQISTQLGGSGGGDDRFGQGGGSIKFKEKVTEVLLSAEQLVIKSIGP